MAEGIAETVRAPSTWSKIGMWFSITGVLVALVAGGCMYSCYPYVHRDSYIDTIRENGEPVIVALERFVQEQGHAPSSLDDLVPRYLPDVPETGYRPQRRFELMTHERMKKLGAKSGESARPMDSPSTWWCVSVNMSMFDLFGDHNLSFDSRTAGWIGPDKGHTVYARWPSAESKRAR